MRPSSPVKDDKDFILARIDTHRTHLRIGYHTDRSYDINTSSLLSIPNSTHTDRISGGFGSAMFFFRAKIPIARSNQPDTRFTPARKVRLGHKSG